MRHAPVIELLSEQKQQLEVWSRSRKCALRLLQRSKIFLLAAEGKLIGACMKHHRQPEWVKFLKQIDRETPPDLDLHLIVDNYVMHTCKATQRWLKRHPRFHVHLIPTSSSWMNLVERCRTNHDNPKPFHWTAKVDDILAKFRHACNALDMLQSE